jgi:NAD(P)-dependent dehydrogenase (short-subunit alcohol dehydrogenase family)
MNRSLVIGASGGIGGAIARTLAGEVVTLSRSKNGFEITDERLIKHHLGRIDGHFDLIFVATGALSINGAQPEKSIKAINMDALTDQYKTNAIGPMMVLKHSLHLLPKNSPSTFAVLSARVGSIGDNKIGGWHSYRAAKAGLNQLMHGAAIELQRTHKKTILLALHPGTVETNFTKDYQAEIKSSPDEAARHLLNVVKTRRLSDSGKFFDYAGAEIPW